MSHPNGNSQHCNESVVLTLLTAPPVLPTENNLQQSWAADRKAWKEYDEEDWLMRQAFEPDMPHNGRSIFFRWLNETVEGKNWICSVPLNGEGTWCDHDPFKRPDRAIAHVRWHLKHTPFACGGQCRNEGCDLRFHSSETLSAHRRGREYRTCDFCGKVELRQNMARHKTDYCAKRPQAAQAEEET